PVPCGTPVGYSLGVCVSTPPHRLPTRVTPSTVDGWLPADIWWSEPHRAIDTAGQTQRVAVPQRQRQQRLRHVLVAHRTQEPAQRGGADRGVQRRRGGRARATVLHRVG